MSKIYSMSNDGKNCPNCGGHFTNAVYYTARPMNTTVNRAVSREALKTTTTTTTTTTYADIIQHSGGVCIKCGLKKSMREMLLSTVGVFIAVGLLVVALSPIKKNTGIFLLALGGAIIIGLVSIIFLQAAQAVHRCLKRQGIDGISTAFVSFVNSNDLTDGQKALSTSDYKRLR